MSNISNIFNLGDKFDFRSPFEGSTPPKKYAYLQRVNLSTASLVDFLRTNLESAIASRRFDYHEFLKLRDFITANLKNTGVTGEKAAKQSDAIAADIPNLFGYSYKLTFPEAPEALRERNIHMNIIVNNRVDEVDFTAPYTNLTMDAGALAGLYTIAFKYVKPVKNGGNYAVKLEFENFEDFSIMLDFFRKDFVIDGRAWAGFKALYLNLFKLFRHEAEQLCMLYLKAPKAILYELGATKLVADLNTIAKLGDYINEGGVNEELAVLNLIGAFYARDPYAGIALPNHEMAVVRTSRAGKPGLPPKNSIEDLMEALAVENDGVTLFEQLYHSLDDRWGDDNFTEFIRMVYTYWSFSSYHNNPKKLPYYGYPENFHYDSDKVLGFYSSDFKVQFSGQYIDFFVVDEEATSKLHPRARAHGNREYKLYGRYHIFQPITLDSTDLSGEIKLPERVIPAFYLKAFEDKNNTANFEKAMWVVAEVAATALAVGNLLRLRYLMYLSNVNKAQKFIRLGIAGLQVATAALSTMLQFVNNCKGGTLCERLRTYLFWLDVGTLGVDLLAQQLMKRAAREAAESYRSYRTSLGDEALEEADFASNEAAQARREVQAHLDEVAEGSGFLGSRVLTETEISEWAARIRKAGAELKYVDESAEMLRYFEINQIGAAFSSARKPPAIWIRKGATDYEIFHESMHLNEFNLIGRKKYLRGSMEFGGTVLQDLMRTYKREKYVFDRVLDEQRLSGRFSVSEIAFSRKYISDIMKRCIDKGIDISKIK